MTRRNLAPLLGGDAGFWTYGIAVNGTRTVYATAPDFNNRLFVINIDVSSDPGDTVRIVTSSDALVLIGSGSSATWRAIPSIR